MAVTNNEIFKQPLWYPENSNLEVEATIRIEKSDDCIKSNDFRWWLNMNPYTGSGCPCRTRSPPLEEYLKNSNYLICPREQINDLRKCMGLNISEIAEILHNTRTTIYEWLNTDNPNLRPENQERLDQIHKICLYWKKKDLGRLSGYTHKITLEDQSLFHLLITDIIHEKIIYRVLDSIANTILNARKQESQREENLKQQGFKELNKKERKNNLDRFIQDMS
jgi:hypothetical protein